MTQLRRPLILLFVLLLGGCRPSATWSTECRSPNAMWVATARTFEYGGFGTASVETVVQIKRSKSFESPQDVLRFAEGGADMGLKLRWDSPSHLIAMYKGAPELLYFQVVKTSGLDISVENISTAQDLHPSARP